MSFIMLGLNNITEVAAPGRGRSRNPASRFLRVKELRPLLRREPFSRELYSQAPVSATDRTRLLHQTGAVGDVALEVVELTGAHGDAYFTDLRLLHTGAPNTADHPRIMATHRFR